MSFTDEVSVFPITIPPLCERREDIPLLVRSLVTSALTLEAAEREHILRVLRETDWVVSGPAGAAARLGMNRLTLQSRMRKLGIARPK